MATSSTVMAHLPHLWEPAVGEEGEEGQQQQLFMAQHVLGVRNRPK